MQTYGLVLVWLLAQDKPLIESLPPQWCCGSAGTVGAASTPGETPPQAPLPPPALPDGQPAANVEEPPAQASPPIADPPDGQTLAIVSSALAGGVWGGAIALLARQETPGVVAAVGSAGAVIGGGTAWGLLRLGYRPSLGQAMWYTNSLAWGSLAGLAAYAGAGVDSPKLRWGLLLGGETVGAGLGLWSARRFAWTPGQVLLTNGLALGAGLAAVGGAWAWSPDSPTGPSPAAAYAFAPLMLGSTLLARGLSPSTDDLRLMGFSTAAMGWTGALLAGGWEGNTASRGKRVLGGASLGLGAGFLGAALASPFVELAPGSVGKGVAGIAAGNAMGLGTALLLDPRDGRRAAWYAGLGGLSLGLGGLVLGPHLRFGEEARPLAGYAAAWAAGTWLAAWTQREALDGREWLGGTLAFVPAATLGGLVASRWFHPAREDYFPSLFFTPLGMSAGLGLARLVGAGGNGESWALAAGSTAGLLGGAGFAHVTKLRGMDLLAALWGGGQGYLLGATLPALREPTWTGDRRTSGGKYLGVPLGVVGGMAWSRATNADAGEIGKLTLGGALGVGMGVGAGALWGPDDARGTRTGLMAGAVGGALGTVLLEQTVGLRTRAWRGSGVGLATAGTAFGLLAGLPLVGAADPLGRIGNASADRLAGGVLLGGSVGLASGLVLGKLVAPSSEAIAIGLGGGIVGLGLGQGAAMTVWPTGTAGERRREGWLTLGGGLLGLGATSALLHGEKLQAGDLLPVPTGLALGGLLGALAPRLAEPIFGGWDRRNLGGLWLGLGAGAIGATAIGHLAKPSLAAVGVATTGGGLGLAMGLGAGLATTAAGSRGPRIGMAVGAGAGVLGAILLDRPLQLQTGTLGSAGLLVDSGLVLGTLEGLGVGSLLASRDPAADEGTRRLLGGALLGGGAGLATGLILAKHIDPGPGPILVSLAGAGLGAMAGRGLGQVATPGNLLETGRNDTFAMLAGSGAGLGLAIAQELTSPLDGTDAVALPLGLAAGGFVGALLPSLGAPTWQGDRRATGGMWLGASLGAMGATRLAHSFGAPPSTVGLSALGGLDGLATGWAIGRLLDGDSTSRGGRAGAVLGLAGGLSLGALAWPGVRWGEESANLVLFSSLIGAWTGGWGATLGQASWEETNPTRLGLGIVAGAGVGSLGAGLAARWWRMSGDQVRTALGMGVLFAGAGAGLGGAASERADGPVWGLVTAGTAGLAMGAAWHERIGLREGLLPHLALSTLEGLWIGAWLPFVFRPARDVGNQEVFAGLVAGGMGSLGLATLAGSVFSPRGETLALSGLGSAIGASLAGGAMLLAPRLDSRLRAGGVLAGTGLGIGLGVAVAGVPRVERAVPRVLVGAGVGMAEGFVFGWSGRAEGRGEQVGASLIGAGVGAGLGLAASIKPLRLTSQWALASAGFGAWGGFVGAFAGATVNRDPHEVLLGSLLGTNAGVVAGYGLLRGGVVDAGEFGWLSAAGLLGTLAGGTAGAIFSSKENPRPLLVGLAAGPLLGLGTGALVLPHLRARLRVQSLRPATVAGTLFDLSAGPPPRERFSSDILEAKRPTFWSRNLPKLKHLLPEVASYTPLIGALPAAPGTSDSTPFLIGIAGTLK